MRHVLAMFCLAVGIAPLFAHASSATQAGKLKPLHGADLDHLEETWMQLRPKRKPKGAQENVPPKYFERLKEIHEQIDQSNHKLDKLNQDGGDEYWSTTDNHHQLMNELYDTADGLHKNYQTSESVQTLNRLNQEMRKVG
ncbi:hypothetical protein F5148DRAFT_661382 [Russula earlei]|uniref:Uncharacterized protein n=1 Tax=Russula earlei TaxID=71964 RepID=A0ACC0UFM6_9AGAM|nr:hypothetical protein F5148DRAFT_661382 [Russula earlei]